MSDTYNDVFEELTDLDDIPEPPPIDRYKGPAVVTEFKYATTNYGPSLRVDVAYPADSPDRKPITHFIDMSFKDGYDVDDKTKGQRTRNYNLFAGLRDALGLKGVAPKDQAAKAIGQTVVVDAFPKFNEKSRLTIGKYSKYKNGAGEAEE